MVKITQVIFLSTQVVFITGFLIGCQSSNSEIKNIQTEQIVSTEELLEIDPFVDTRQQMVEMTIKSRGISDPDVLLAMQSVPRHAFVPEKFLNSAYGDHPLPIGYGQTISQPYIVAWMTELLELKPGDKVLEIGTGSGYQAAVLSELEGVQVYSLEIIPELADRAQAVLQDLSYVSVTTKQGDGYFGWQEKGPFNAIIVTAAPDHLPAPLTAQLDEDGRLVVPIGPPGGYQRLWKFVREGDEIKAYSLGGVRFVPFTGGGIQGAEIELSPEP